MLLHQENGQRVSVTRDFAAERERARTALVAVGLLPEGEPARLFRFDVSDQHRALGDRPDPAGRAVRRGGRVGRGQLEGPPHPARRSARAGGRPPGLARGGRWGRARRREHPADLAHRGPAQRPALSAPRPPEVRDHRGGAARPAGGGDGSPAPHADRRGDPARGRARARRPGRRSLLPHDRRLRPRPPRSPAARPAARTGGARRVAGDLAAVPARGLPLDVAAGGGRGGRLPGRRHGAGQDRAGPRRVARAGPARPGAGGGPHLRHPGLGPAGRPLRARSDRAPLRRPRPAEGPRRPRPARPGHRQLRGRRARRRAARPDHLGGAGPGRGPGHQERPQQPGPGRAGAARPTGGWR